MPSLAKVINEPWVASLYTIVEIFDIGRGFFGLGVGLCFFILLVVGGESRLQFQGIGLRASLSGPCCGTLVFTGVVL